MVGRRHMIASAGWMPRRAWTAILASGFLSVACATTPPVPLESLTDFVVAGTTTRTEIEARLGPPARYFAGERIAVYVLGYRFTNDGHGGVKQVPAVNITRARFRICATAGDCQRQLMLQYDDSDLVVRHELR